VRTSNVTYGEKKRLREILSRNVKSGVERDHNKNLPSSPATNVLPVLENINMTM
jgi:hypothetical protein